MSEKGRFITQYSVASIKLSCKQVNKQKGDLKLHSLISLLFG